jgi:hypothetical protein
VSEGARGAGGQGGGREGGRTSSVRADAVTGPRGRMSASARTRGRARTRE